MKKKCLIITYCFPPYPSPESFITSKLVSGLSNYYHITILTLESVEDSKEFDKKYKNIRIIRVKLPSFINWIINLPRVPFRPDRFIISLYWLFKKIKKISIESFDIIFTRSQFHSSHLIGLYLKKKFPKKKWIASFSDPWSKNIFQRNIPIFTTISNYLEKKVLSNTDVLIFPLINLRDHFNETSKIDIIKKSIIVNHSFDEKYFNYSKNITENKYFTVRHFGKIYAERNIFPLFEALKQIIKEGIKIKAEIYIDIDFIEKNKSIIKHFNNYFKITSYVKYSNYIKLINKSDLLVIIDGNSHFLNVFFQSKVTDYLGSRKMMLHIGKCNTINKELTIKNNGLSCLNETNDIKDKILKSIKTRKNFKPNLKLIDDYKITEVTKKLYNDLSKHLK